MELNRDCLTVMSKEQMLPRTPTFDSAGYTKIIHDDSVSISSALSLNITESCLNEDGPLSTEENGHLPLCHGSKDNDDEARCALSFVIDPPEVEHVHLKLDQSVTKATTGDGGNSKTLTLCTPSNRLSV